MTAAPVPGVTLKTIKANGIHMRYAETGSGPLVLFCHGWPESWYSWRHQLAAVSAAGFRCVAPDMRGYGGTEAPEPIDQYTLFHLVGDMAELVKALGETQGRHRRPRLGRAGRLACSPVAARPVHRGLRHERALRAAGLCRHPDRAGASSGSPTSTCSTSRSPACPRPSCSRTSAARCAGSTSRPAASSRRRARASPG